MDSLRKKVDAEYKEKEKREKYAKETKSKLEKLEDTFGRLSRMKGELAKGLGNLKQSTQCDLCN